MMPQTQEHKQYAITFDDEQRKIIRSQFFPPSATDQDMIYCMGVAKEMGLNPILNEIYFVERKANIDGQWQTKIAPMAGKNAYLKLAHQTGLFDGMESFTEVREIPALEGGEWVMKKDLIAIAIVFRADMDRPFKKEVAYSEYCQTTKSGEPTKFWKEKPHTMLKKVAESQALREAFSLYGIYDESEIETSTTSYESLTLQKAVEKQKPKRSRLRAHEVEAQNVADALGYDEETGDIIDDAEIA